MKYCVLTIPICSSIPLGMSFLAYSPLPPPDTWLCLTSTNSVSYGSGTNGWSAINVLVDIEYLSIGSFGKSSPALLVETAKTGVKIWVSGSRTRSVNRVGSAATIRPFSKDPSRAVCKSGYRKAMPSLAVNSPVTESTRPTRNPPPSWYFQQTPLGFPQR